MWLLNYDFTSYMQGWEPHKADSISEIIYNTLSVLFGGLFYKLDQNITTLTTKLS
jgi:hypothetical protein